MGQYWRVIAPHGRKISGDWGKLGEFLLDGSAAELAMQLAVPVVEWIDRDGDLAALMTSSHDTSHAVLSSCTFESLPTEIHSMIFSHLTSYVDAFHLSLATLYFWRLGRQHLKKIFASSLSPLANEAIICVGDCSTTEYFDYPANLLTNDEKTELKAGLEPGEKGYYRQGGPVNLYTLAGARYSEVESGGISGKRWMSDLAELETRNFPEHERSQALALAYPKYEQLYPEDKKWVLRNLTSREFVRADAIAIKEEYVRGPTIEELGFGEVVLARICWSSDPSFSMAYNGKIHRGVWAGCRFDITTADRLEKENGEGQWRDVSEEVAKEIEAIWESEFGGEWRK